jgi:hypothetical protein
MTHNYVWEYSWLWDMTSSFHHIMFTRNGNTIRWYFDWKKLSENTYSQSFYDSPDWLYIWRSYENYANFHWYIDELRIIKWYSAFDWSSCSVWQQCFTPPTSPY